MVSAAACNGTLATPGHSSILWAGGVAKIWLTCLLFSCLVLFTLLWEFFTEYLERKVHAHLAYAELLERVFKELTLLGLLSFGLFIIQDSFSVQISHDLLVSFEFAHYLIFFMAIIFVLKATISMRGSLATKKEWDAAAATSVHEVCDDYARTLHWAHTSCCGRLLGSVRLLGSYLQLTGEQQSIEWFLLRVLFLREYGVQIHFDFAKYTRKSLTQAIMRGIANTPMTWCFMLACLLTFAAVDLSQKVTFADATVHTRRLASASSPATHLTQTQAVFHVVLVASISWLAMAVQLGLLFLLRNRQKQLLRRKLHMHGWTGE
jgi:hypothetical protein